MTEHTPTPWFKNRKLEIGPRPRTDDQHDGMLHPVADVFGDNGEADAAFIIKAVNSHGIMVEVLKEIVAYSSDAVAINAAKHVLDLVSEAGCQK